MVIQGGGDVLVPAHLNFGKYILDCLRNAKQDATCLIFLRNNDTTGEKLTYSEFLAHAVRLSASLSALGARRGCTVAVAGEPRAVFLPTTLAVILTGAAYTPLELECGNAVLAHKFNQSRPEYVICSRSFWELYSNTMKGLDYIKTFICFDDTEDIELSVASLVSRSGHVEVDAFEPALVSGATDVAMVVHSSGTTGMPKGVMLTHLNCIATVANREYYHNFESLRTCLIRSDFSAAAVFLTYYFLCAGKTVVHSEIIELKTIQNYQVDTVPTIPGSLGELLYAERPDDYDLSSLKIVYAYAGKLQPAITEAIKKRYPHIKLLQMYGSTEVSLLTVQEPSDTELLSVGVPVPGVNLKVVDVETRAPLGPNQRGEICARTPALMKGYLGSSTEYLDDQGFYLTGDLGYYDERNRFYVLDRLEDIVRYGEKKICPSELEAVLVRHGAVREVAVAGKPAGAAGEVPAAFVVLQPGANVTEGELLEYVDSQVSECMRLRGGVRFLSELPKSHRGKLLRPKLREILAVE